MASTRPTFDVKRKGYDRFAVDDAVESYAQKIDQLEKTVATYQQQLVDMNAQLERLKERYQAAVNSEAVRQEISDEISRISIREANDIINVAHKNADLIVQEALQSARGILEDLAILYQEAGLVKKETKEKLEYLLKYLDEFRLPEMPDLKWLQDAEDKLL